MFKIKRNLLCFLLLILGSKACGMTKDCLVFNSPQKYKTVKRLESGVRVISLDLNKKPTVVEDIIGLVFKDKTNQLAVIETEIGEITVGVDQPFLDLDLNEWVVAKDITNENYVYYLNKEKVPVLNVEILDLEVPVDVYHIEARKNHNFFIMDSDGNAVLTHNGITVSLASLLIKMGMEAAAAKAFAGTATVVLSTSAKKIIWSTVSTVAPPLAILGLAGYGIAKAFMAFDDWNEERKWGKIRKKIEKEKREGSFRCIQEEINSEVRACKTAAGLRCLDNTYTQLAHSCDQRRELEQETRKYYPGDKAKQRTYIKAVEDAERDRINKENEAIRASIMKNAPRLVRTASPKPPKKDDNDDDDSADSNKGREGGASIRKTKTRSRDRICEDKAKHIFRDKKGHFKQDTRKNRVFIERIANDKSNYLGPDKRGNQWYGKTLKNGKQVWVEVRNGEIRNAGINDVPKSYNSITGLKKFV